MSIEIKNYMRDGAHYQARAVLCYLQCYDGIENSWNKEFLEYDARILVGRWENCREQGYVIMLRNNNMDQLNIAWFEHRNSDEICAIKWNQNSINSPNIDNSEFDDIYKDKYDLSYSVGYGKVVEMADWIWDQLESHWESE